MKRSTVAAIVIAVLLVFSVFLFRAYRNTPATASANTGPQLLGEWQLDSVYAIAPAGNASAVSAPIQKGAIHFKFKADSTLEQFTGSDSLVMHYYQQDSALFIDKGAGYTAHALKQLSDSLISFATADSLVYVLKRK